MKKLLFLISVFCLPASAMAADGLLYFEAQGIAGRSSAESGAIWHSGSAADAMQKNGVGMDYVQKLSGAAGDWGTLSVQARLVWDDGRDEFRPQLYDAYFKAKTPIADAWIGHGRIPFGLSSYLDSHAALLQPLAMHGFGFDRDWGVGISRDLERGDVRAALTTGSGMGVRREGNWLASARASYGVLSFDNWTAGASFMGGRPFAAMGYEVMGEPEDAAAVGIDAAYNHDRYEHRFEGVGGRMMNEKAFAGLYRFGVNFLDENRLKLEVQALYTDVRRDADWRAAAGLAYRLTEDLTLRVMY